MDKYNVNLQFSRFYIHFGFRPSTTSQVSTQQARVSNRPRYISEPAGDLLSTYYDLKHELEDSRLGLQYMC